MHAAHALFVLSAFLLAVGTVLTRHVLTVEPASTISPVLLLPLQLTGGLLALGAAHLLAGRPVIAVGLLPRLMAGGMALGVGSIGTVVSLAFITASEAALIFAMQPVTIIVLAWLLLDERAGPALMVLSLLAVGGVVLIVLAGGGTAGAEVRAAGIGFAALSTLCAALYAVLMRGTSGRVRPLTALMVVQGAALAFAVSVAAAWLLLSGAPLPAGTMASRLGAVGIGGIYYGAAFAVFLIGLQRTEAGVAGVYLNLVPVFAIALGAVFLGERLGPMQWAGAAIALLAVTGVAALALRDRTAQYRRSTDQSPAAQIMAVPSQTGAVGIVPKNTSDHSAAKPR